jgi:hypothetical protein
LSLVRKLTELHDGSVGVASVRGKGSRFTVWLPCHDAPIPSAEPPAEAVKPWRKSGRAKLALVSQ